MSFYYNNTEQISEIVTEKPYKFKLPKFGKTTTDITYYEPSATRIANMRNSASSAPNLYDFTGDKIPDVSDVSVMIGRKPYFTQEEMSQIETKTTQSVKSQSKAAKKAESDKKEDISNTIDILESIRDTKNDTKDE